MKPKIILDQSGFPSAKEWSAIGPLYETFEQFVKPYLDNGFVPMQMKPRRFIKTCFFGKELLLSPAQFTILYYLMIYHSWFVPYKEIYEFIYGNWPENETNNHDIANFIMQLRNILSVEFSGYPSFIESKRKLGYRFRGFDKEFYTLMEG